MQISILTTATTSATSANGKPYQKLEVNYKDLGFGKVASKTLLPFGAQKAAFDGLVGASTGSVFNITVVKNDKGYNDWTAVSEAPPGALGVGTLEVPSGNYSVSSQKTSPTAVKSTYETPEERAKKQIYIIKQSSLTNAINTLSVGSKSAPAADAVLALASTYSSWVLSDEVKDAIEQDVFSLPNDLEVE